MRVAGARAEELRARGPRLQHVGRVHADERHAADRLVGPSPRGADPEQHARLVRGLLEHRRKLARAEQVLVVRHRDA